MKALFIGRFQPVHKGHLQVLQGAAREYDELIIGMGSSQYSHTFENPFTADERKQMLSDSLETAGVTNYRIVLIPDIHNPPKWVDHVLSIVSDFDVVLSNNPLTRRLFQNKGYQVKSTPVFERDRYAGREIRRRMKMGDTWESLVPEAAARFIKNINGVERVQQA
jgi:nicotinamide-nucleotide adenylyltransferase